MKIFEYDLITDTQGVSELCRKASAAGIISLDTEFMREKVYFAELCLLQIAIGDEYFLLDTLVIDDPGAIQLLANLLANKDVTKIIHSCTQDVEVLSQHFGVKPEAIFDTQLAAGFCAYDGQVGYANLVEEVCGVELDKSQTRTNWLQRPLSQKQLNYAVNDVVYLHALYEKFSEELVVRQRNEWFESEIEALVQATMDNQNPDLAYTRLNGSNLSIQKQALLVYLATMRESNAQASNKPRPWILKDSDLYDVAHAFPETHQDLFELDIRAGFIKRNADQILDFITNIDPQEPAKWSNSKPLNAVQKSQVKQLSQQLNTLSEKQGVARSIIANRKDIESYVGGRGAKFEQGWRAELLGDSLSSILSS